MVLGSGSTSFPSKTLDFLGNIRSSGPPFFWPQTLPGKKNIVSWRQAITNGKVYYFLSAQILGWVYLKKNTIEDQNKALQRNQKYG